MTTQVATEAKTIVIRGGGRLTGRVTVDGAKNAALPAMAAALLTDEECLLDNVPVLEDVLVMVDLLRGLGADVDFDQDNHRLRIQAANIRRYDAPSDLVERMRASFLVSGPLLSRYGEASSSSPGGCKLGTRPVDVDLRGFRQMGATIEQADGDYMMRARRRAETRIAERLSDIDLARAELALRRSMVRLRVGRRTRGRAPQPLAQQDLAS